MTFTGEPGDNEFVSAKGLLGNLMVFAAVAILVYTAGIVGKNFRFSSSAQLEQLWREDITHLNHENKLPAHWADIKEIEKTAATGDAEAERWIHEITVPITVNPHGEYKLEILFLSQNDEKHHRAVVQMHMVHIQSGNSIWEFGRTYDLN